MDRELTISLKVAAGYLVIVGMVGIVWPLLGLGPHHPEFEAQSLGYKIGAYAREHTINILFLVSGIVIFMKRNWGRKLALVVLVVSTIYTSNAFAWSYAQGEPTQQIRLVALAIIGAWNGIWFFLLVRRSSREALA